MTLGAGGFVDTPNQRLPVAAARRSARAEDLAATCRSPSERARRCAWATSPRWWRGTSAPIGDAIINDGPGLLLIVEKQPWGNTLEVTREVEEALRSTAPRR